MDKYITDIDSHKAINIAMDKDRCKLTKEQRASLEGAFCAEIRDTPAADVAPLAHGKPVVRNRPEFYKKYEAVGWSEEGERLYIRRIILDDKKTVEYCPVCAKRLCSRFNNYCPHCGAKMIKED